jgi:hypothetical protein
MAGFNHERRLGETAVARLLKLSSQSLEKTRISAVLPGRFFPPHGKREVSAGQKEGLVA